MPHEPAHSLETILSPASLFRLTIQHSVWALEISLFHFFDQECPSFKDIKTGLPLEKVRHQSC